MSAADLDRANLDAARLSEARNGPSRAYCRLYVSKDGGSDQPETPGAPRCWLQPGHDGRCQPSPDRIADEIRRRPPMGTSTWSTLDVAVMPTGIAGLLRCLT